MAKKKEEPTEDKKSFKDKLQELKTNENFHSGVQWIWDNRIMVFSGALLLLGIIFAFYYVYFGGFLVGLGLGIAFFGEIEKFFASLRSLYTKQGLFKSLMIIGTVIFFLIAIPLFIIGLGLGVLIVYLLKWRGIY